MKENERAGTSPRVRAQSAILLLLSWSLLAACTASIRESTPGQYTADAVKDARKNLEQARRAGDRAVECRREVLEARKALEKGKK